MSERVIRGAASQNSPAIEATEPFITLKEKLIGGTLLAAVALAGAAIYAEDKRVLNDISSSLSDDARKYVDGFDKLGPGEGETPQTIFGEVRSASVHLNTGARCTILYATYGEGLSGVLFDNKGTVVDTGTCPQVPARP